MFIFDTIDVHFQTVIARWLLAKWPFINIVAVKKKRLNQKSA